MLDAALAGLWAAAAMYGKYWSAVLLLGLATAALAHPAVRIISVRARRGSLCRRAVLQLLPI